MHTRLSTCPVVKIEDRHLFELVTVAGSSRYLAFDKRILWLRESEAEVIIKHDGILLKECHSNNDWYGFLTSAEVAIEEAKKIAAKYHATPDGPLQVCVHVTIKDVPVLEDLSSEGVDWNRNAQRRRYLTIAGQHTWYTGDQRINPDDPHDWRRPMLEPVIVVVPYELYCTAMRDSDRPAAWIAKYRAEALDLGLPSQQGAKQ